MLGLKLYISSDHFSHDGSMKVRCIASVAPLLWQGDKESVLQKFDKREALLLGKLKNIIVLVNKSIFFTLFYPNLVVSHYNSELHEMYQIIMDVAAKKRIVRFYKLKNLIFDGHPKLCCKSYVANHKIPILNLASRNYHYIIVLLKKMKNK